MAGALIYSPLSLLGLPGLFYVYIPWVEDAYQSLFKERRVRMSVVDVVLVTGTLATSQYFASALLASFFTLSKKLSIKAEDHSQKKLINAFAGLSTDENSGVHFHFHLLVHGGLVFFVQAPYCTLNNI